ncbi:hypothetical protein LWI29_007196 [Acer saccharum]|uniref:Uncharacterized protein n=1 Tax=Acer saccharum TaxID=4024 RepID=A0AA39RLB2_ACESA|nr:hypothetical protein LWI29_007196 [Acer saccharum]
MAAAAKRMYVDYSPQVAEAVSILTGINFAAETGLVPMIVKTDALSVVNRDTYGQSKEKTTEAFKEFGQILATNKANEYERIAHELQRINIRRVDQVRVMKMFVQKPEIAGIFKASDSDEDKQQFIMEILAGKIRHRGPVIKKHKDQHGHTSRKAKIRQKRHFIRTGNSALALLGYIISSRPSRAEE